MPAPSEESESQKGPSQSDLKPYPCSDLAPAPADPDAVNESIHPNDAVTEKFEPVAVADHGEEIESNHREAIPAPTPSDGSVPAPATEAATGEEDQKREESGAAPTPSGNGSKAPPPTSLGEDTAVLELRKEEGSRTFTMRELLSGLKDDQAHSSREASKPDIGSPDSELERLPNLDNTAMELISSVTGVDEEGRSRQRILTYAARRYASAIDRNPGDYDALYNWALVLQESADNVDPDSTSPSKDALLEEACKRYEEATHLCPTLNDAYYNWAIAISDRARMRGRTKEAEELWKRATKHYEKAVQLNWNSPQALNNWGLALQELSAIVPAKEKQAIVRTAICKFRAAILLQFDFHRAIYNLGTVLYGLAEDTLRVGASGMKETSANELYSQCAIYIAAAHALKPNYSVYCSALRLVRSMLPLPYLKVGYMTAPPPGSPISPHNEWKQTQFVLNHEGLYQLVPDDQRQMRRSLSGKLTDAKPSVKVEIADIVSVSPCADLTLPPGAGLCIDTIHGPVYLVADSWEAFDGWLDAIRLVYTIFARGKIDVLAGIITG